MCFQTTTETETLLPLSSAGIQYHPVPNTQKPNRRLKLWELEDELHCSVIGTCVPVSELRRIYQKVSHKASKHLSDYKIHSLFVRGASDTHDATRLLHKYLERTYKTAVQRFNKARDEAELTALWDEALEKGDVAGAYWALLSHPAITHELGTRIFGDVHMLSHLAGAARRADRRKHRCLSIDHSSLRQKLSKQEKTIRQLREQLQQSEERLQHCENELRQRDDELQTTQRQLKELQNGRAWTDLQDELAELRQKQEITERRTAESHQASLLKLQAREQELSERLHQQQQDNELLERQLQRLLHSEPLDATFDLCGRNILYVGGRSRSKTYYRSLVEQHNGCYLHHDGGLEDGWQRLQALLQKADAVFCPIECISHSAVNSIKQCCKREAKPMIMLRSDSFAAFSRELVQAAAA